MRVSIEIPFMTFSFKPTDIEKKVARELLIRLPDKRVLNANECCDGCIKNALASLQEVRKILVDKQVELADYHDGGLYLLMELMTEVIRQFLTYDESLKQQVCVNQNAPELRHIVDVKHAYFEALNQLRFHMHSCLNQISKIAEMETPKINSYLKANDAWMLSLYLQPEGLLNNESA